jgi:hypothetical protein
VAIRSRISTNRRPGNRYACRGVAYWVDSIGDSLVAFRLAWLGEAPSLWSRTIDRPNGQFWSKAIALALATMLRVVAVWRWRRRVASE